MMPLGFHNETWLIRWLSLNKQHCCFLLLCMLETFYCHAKQRNWTMRQHFWTCLITMPMKRNTKSVCLITSALLEPSYFISGISYAFQLWWDQLYGRSLCLKSQYTCFFYIFLQLFIILHTSFCLNFSELRMQILHEINFLLYQFADWSNCVTFADLDLMLECCKAIIFNVAALHSDQLAGQLIAIKRLWNVAKRL